MEKSTVAGKFPQDQGWAWMICFGGFITHAVLGCGAQITSVLFVELVERFDSTITTASLILMCHILAFSVSTVLFPTMVLPRLGERWTLVLGGCLLFIASVGFAFAPSMGVFITFSVLKGIASGCVFVPCSTLIRVYFQKRMSTASVIAYCGASVAAIVAPFVIRAVRTEYGISGAYLIQAAVELNVCVAGMLMRPVSSYGCVPEKPDETSEVTREHGLLSTDIKAEYPSADKVFLEKGEFNVFNHQWNRQVSVTHRSDQLPTIEEDELATIKLLSSDNSKEKTNPDRSSLQAGSSSEISALCGPVTEPCRSPTVSIASGKAASTKNVAGKDKTTEQDTISNGHSVVGDCIYVNGTSQKPVFVSCTNAEELLKSQAYQILLEQEKCLLSRELSVDVERSKAPYGSVFTLASEAGRAVEVLMIEEMTSPDDRKGFKRWRHLYNNSSLGLWAFRMTLIAALPGTVNQYLAAYMPTITNSLGASLDEAATLVTIMGAVDLFSRLGMGLIADTKIIPPSKMLSIAQIIMGIVCQFVWLFTTFPVLIVMVMLMGLFVGARVSLLPLVCGEVVGREKMPKAYSISAMSTALMGATWSPILGAMAESTKSFVAVVHFIGAGYILSGLLMLTLPFFSRLDKKCEKTKSQNHTDL